MPTAPLRRLSFAVLILAVLAALPAAAYAAPTVGVIEMRRTHAANLYDSRAVRYQDPDYTACVATSTLMMLNMTAWRGATGTGWRWNVSTSFATQSSMHTWTRAHDTLAASGAGSDPHGWRNALSFYGWGDYTSAGRVYADVSYGSYDEAVKAAIRAIATTKRPVGILAWAGGHAQILHGYTVYGRDPARSSDFVVRSVRITDPLQSDGLRNAELTNTQFRSGSSTYRFVPYTWRDSPADDPYTPGTRPSHDEWYGRWVIVAPTR
jgi:hypothetical protein